MALLFNGFFDIFKFKPDSLFRFGLMAGNGKAVPAKSRYGILMNIFPDEAVWVT
jgi:hypothetical protein